MLDLRAASCARGDAAEAPSAIAPAKAPPSGSHGEPLASLALPTHAVVVAASPRGVPGHCASPPRRRRCDARRSRGSGSARAAPRAGITARGSPRTSAGTHAAIGSLADVGSWQRAHAASATSGTVAPGFTSAADVSRAGTSAPAPQRTKLPSSPNVTPCAPSCAGWHVAHVSSPRAASARCADRADACCAPARDTSCMRRRRRTAAVVRAAPVEAADAGVALADAARRLVALRAGDLLLRVRMRPGERALAAARRDPRGERRRRADRRAERRERHRAHARDVARAASHAG